MWFTATSTSVTDTFGFFRDPPNDPTIQLCAPISRHTQKKKKKPVQVTSHTTTGRRRENLKHKEELLCCLCGELPISDCASWPWGKIKCEDRHTHPASISATRNWSSALSLILHSTYWLRVFFNLFGMRSVAGAAVAAAVTWARDHVTVSCVCVVWFDSIYKTHALCWEESIDALPFSLSLFLYLVGDVLRRANFRAVPNQSKFNCFMTSIKMIPARYDSGFVNHHEEEEEEKQTIHNEETWAVVRCGKRKLN